MLPIPTQCKTLDIFGLTEEWDWKPQIVSLVIFQNYLGGQLS